MNVKVSTEVTETTRISNDNCTVVLINGDITSIKVERSNSGGSIEFGAKFAEFEQFVQNCVDVYHSVRLRQIDERRSADELSPNT